ncbi:MAG: S8 family peptidase [Bacteroidota bacterium]|nr:S8 family peptidase [Bacteroidota bacterium]
MVTRSHRRFNSVKIIAGLFLLFICPEWHISAQEPAWNYFYRVYFRDKGENNINSFSLRDLFTERAVERRWKMGQTSPDFRDIPVSSGYIRQITALGLKLHCKSRWLNTALFKSTSPVDVNKLLNLPFIAEVQAVKHPMGKSIPSDKLRFELTQSGPLSFDRPVSMLNGITVHNSGFTGRGILIAVLDGGFTNADKISSLEELRNRNGIITTLDVVGNSDFVYSYHGHGTAVLSVLAGNISGSIEGSAPGADFCLIRTEDVSSEFPVEEDFWVAGAEFADSLGADIISSSLGYFTFDDPLLDNKFSDMDGNTTFVTKGADIAASRGILTVCSAGNERNNSWVHIIAPSDGDSVLAIGAVDGNMAISSFSSSGPSYDRRVKPDVVAQGVSVPVQVSASSVDRSSGTSFSCPVISGMCACIMQAVPEATSADIISALHEASDRFHLPDSLYGYGIPDITLAIKLLQERLLILPENGSVLYPNPFNDLIKITFRESPSNLTVEIFDASGRLINKAVYKEYISRSVTLDAFREFPAGIYFIRIITTDGTTLHKAIKIRN